MNFLDSIILGLVQGITEFLPISSSGHLILFREMLGIDYKYGLSVDAILQLATAFAIIIFFRKKIIFLVSNSFKNLNLFCFLIIGTIPAALIGYFFESKIEQFLRHSLVVASALLIGSLIMYLAENYQNSRKVPDKKINFISSIKIGVFQALSLIPGMSRSGMTISGGYLAGLNKFEAAEWSFILGVPLLIGSGLKKLLDISISGALNGFGLELLVSSVFAFSVGLISIKYLFEILKNRGLMPFIWYRIVLVGLILLFFFV